MSLYLLLVFVHILAVFAFLMAQRCVFITLPQNGNGNLERIRVLMNLSGSSIRGRTHFPACHCGGDGLHGQLVGAWLDLGLTRSADRDVCCCGVRFLWKGA